MALYKCATCNQFETINLFTPEACSGCGGRMILQIDPEQRPRFDFLSTPQHAWLLVHRSIFERLGLSLANLSPASRISPNGTIALAEEPDAKRFMDCWQDRHGSISIHENRFSTGIIADWPCARVVTTTT